MKLIWIATTCLLLATSSFAAERFDIVIRGGRIVDGTGAPWYVGDIGIRGGRIAAIGRLGDAQAERSIDASGLVVAPGFIDMMGQTAVPMLEDSQAGFNLLTQGITTINAGEGHSAAPLDEESAKRAGWRTMAEFFDHVDSVGLPINGNRIVNNTILRFQKNLSFETIQAALFRLAQE